jgi:hypothetical protein
LAGSAHPADRDLSSCWQQRLSVSQDGHPEAEHERPTCARPTIVRSESVCLGRTRDSAIPASSDGFAGKLKAAIDIEAGTSQHHITSKSSWIRTVRPLGYCAAVVSMRHFWIDVLRPQIVASHHLTGAVAQGDHSVRVLGCQLFVQPTSNFVPPRALSLRGRIGCVRSSHVAPHCPDFSGQQLTYSMAMSSVPSTASVTRIKPAVWPLRHKLRQKPF